MATLITNHSTAGGTWQAIVQELGNPKLSAVDITCSFIMNSGAKLLLELLEHPPQGSSLRTCQIRLICTTYLGISDARAVNQLAEAGIQIRIFNPKQNGSKSFHAKAWRFYHGSVESGTAIVGSSNLSQTPMQEGHEWNVLLKWEQSTTMALQAITAEFEDI